MKYHIFQLILTFTMYASVAQVKIPCNKETLIDRYVRIIPVEVCIPKGYIIDEILDPTDVDGDGNDEFIFSYRKKLLQDGDTIFVSIYKNIGEGHYGIIKTFGNLFPIFFKNYRISYDGISTSLENLWSRYNGMFPLLNLQIENDRISIKFMCAAGEGYTLTYRFDKQRLNWKLEKYEKWIEYFDETKIEELDVDSYKFLIDGFNYFDFMY